MDERIRVVSAAIVWRPEGALPRLLLGQRGPEQAFPLAWCTPGGKVEKGEADLDAIERELSEEMQFYVDAAEFALLGSFSLAPPAVARALILTTYVVEGLSPAHKFSASDEIIGFGWFTAEEMQRLPLTPGDRAALPALLKLLGEEVEEDDEDAPEPMTDAQAHADGLCELGPDGPCRECNPIDDEQIAKEAAREADQRLGGVPHTDDDIRMIQEEARETMLRKSTTWGAFAVGYFLGRCRGFAAGVLES